MFRKQRLAFVGNPHSGKGTPRAGLSLAVGSILADPQWRFTPGTLEELDGVAGEIRDRHPEILVFAGGDGTVQQYLTRIIRSYNDTGAPLPRFLILPTGTMNNLATVLGTTWVRADRLARHIRTKLDRGDTLRTRRLRSMCVSGEYGFIYGAGLPVEVIARYNDLGAGGAGNALRTLGEAIAGEKMRRFTWGRFGFRPEPVSASLVFTRPSIPGVPGVPFVQTSWPSDEYSALIVGTISNLGLGCQALPNAEMNEGLTCRASRLSVQSLAVMAGVVWAGLPLPDTEDFEASQVEIKFGRPTRRMLDGELKPPADSDTLSVGPRLEFIVG